MRIPTSMHPNEWVGLVLNAVRAHEEVDVNALDAQGWVQHSRTGYFLASDLWRAMAGAYNSDDLSGEVLSIITSIMVVESKVREACKQIPPVQLGNGDVPTSLVELWQEGKKLAYALRHQLADDERKAFVAGHQADGANL